MIQTFQAVPVVLSQLQSTTTPKGSWDCFTSKQSAFIQLLEKLP